MKRLVKFVIFLVMSAVVTINACAQANIVINLSIIAEGTEYDGDRVCALMTEMFLASDEGQGFLDRLNSFTAAEGYSSEVQQMQKGLEGLKKLRKQYAGKTDAESLAALEHIDEEISQYEQAIKHYGGMTTSRVNAEELLEVARSHSAGGRLYYGAEYIDHGYWAVGISKDYKTPTSKYGVINSAGDVVIPFIYNYLEAYPDIKMLKTCDFGKRKEGLIRYDGSVVLESKYDLVNRGSSSSFVIIDNNGNDSKCGVTDLDGNIVIPQIYKEIEPFVYNLDSGSYEFYVIMDSKTKLKAVFDHNFKQITGFLYDGWLNEQPYFVGVKPQGNNDVYDARTWQELKDGIPQEYWNHRFKESLE